jgi:hypothetical protein
VACLEKALHLARGAGSVAFVDKGALRVERVGEDAGTAANARDMNQPDMPNADVGITRQRACWNVS